MSETAEKKTEEVRGHRKEKIGVVKSNKMDKTLVVEVERRVPHPLYRKIVKRFSKFYAHDEKNEALIGDRVRIQETRPLSKLKNWRLVEVVERTKEAENQAAAAK